ncbi:MAG: hypothetical protein AAGA09_08345 [Pseudomonadota bacterium]
MTDGRAAFLVGRAGLLAVCAGAVLTGSSMAQQSRQQSDQQQDQAAEALTTRPVDLTNTAPLDKAAIERNVDARMRTLSLEAIQRKRRREEMQAETLQSSDDDGAATAAARDRTIDMNAQIERLRDAARREIARERAPSREAPSAPAEIERAPQGQTAPVVQERPTAPTQRRVPDAVRRALERAVERATENENSQETDQTSAVPGADTETVIRFDAVLGDPIQGGTALDDQYSESHGVRFGPGATIEQCRRASTNATAYVPPSPCGYDRAASGQNAAHYDPRRGRGALRVDFARAVSGFSFKVNPTGGEIDTSFQVLLNGFDADGERIARATQSFVWRQDAFAWPTTAALRASNGARIDYATIELRPQRGETVRFLFDDFSLDYAPDENPVVADLRGETRPPRLARPQVVQSPEDPAVARELRIYPAATRIRTVIDWPAARNAVARQDARGIGPAGLSDRRAIDVAELPVILPSRADGGTLSVVGQRDSYHADFDRDGIGYSVYGTRVLTRVARAPGGSQPANNLRIIELEYGLAATFSLYGASYTVTRYCRNDNPAEDPACYDRDALGDLAAELAVVIGANGERSP